MIEFNQENHTYTDSDTGENIPSVSEIIRVNEGNKYENVDKEVMERACNYGTEIHRQIEAYEENGEWGFSDEIKTYLNLKPKNWVFEECEQIIFGKTPFGNYAGTYDLLFKKEIPFNTGGFDISGDYTEQIFETKKILVDLKTNCAVNKDYVQKQLSLYKYRRDFDYLFCIWLRGDKGKLIPIEYLGDDWVNDYVKEYYNKINLKGE